MLNEVEAHNSQGAILNLALDDISDGIVLSGVDGLDPVEAKIVTSSFATVDGTQYHAASRADRNIVFHFDLEPDYTTESVKDVRKRLYAYFMPKTPVDLIFKDTVDPDVTISGRIESCGAPLFTKEPKMDVSIICFRPDFVDPVEVVVSHNTVSDSSTFTINYPGTVETGIVFKMTLNRSLTEFTLTNTAGDGELQRMDFASPLLSGDVLEINTIALQKDAKRTRSGIEVPLLYGVSPQSSWIELRPGINTFRIYAAGAAIPCTITYTAKYGGL